MTGQLTMSDSVYFGGVNQQVVWEGTTADAHETFLRATDPTTADRIVTLPDATGDVALVAHDDNIISNQVFS